MYRNLCVREERGEGRGKRGEIEEREKREESVDMGDRRERGERIERRERRAERRERRRARGERTERREESRKRNLERATTLPRLAGVDERALVNDAAGMLRHAPVVIEEVQRRAVRQRRRRPASRHIAAPKE